MLLGLGMGRGGGGNLITYLGLGPGLVLNIGISVEVDTDGIVNTFSSCLYYLHSHLHSLANVIKSVAKFA